MAGMDGVELITAERGALPLTHPAQTLAGETQREWLLPGADECFRGIYTRSGTGSSEILAVCSAIAGEGKTTISLGLAVTIAQDYPERRVLVVETDAERSVLAKDFGLEARPGLFDCLADNQPVHTAYRPT